MSHSNSAITFQFERDDLEAFQRFFWRTSRHVQRRVKRLQLMFGLVAAGLVLMGISRMVPDWNTAYRIDGTENHKAAWFFVAFGIAEGIFCAFVPALSLRSTVRQTMRFAKEHGLERQFGSRTLRIDGDVLELTHPQGTTRYKIAELLAPVSTDTHCFLMLTEASAVVVAKKKVVEGDLDALLLQFQQVQQATH